MLNLSSIMIGTMRQKELSDFYTKVFQKEPDMNEEKFSGWTVGMTFFSVGEHSEMGGDSKDAGRIMFNFETTEVKEEFERIKSLGATVVKEPYQMGEAWIATLADLDGNYFQLMTPWEAQ